MESRVISRDNYCAQEQQLEKCSMCGSAVYDGDEIYLTRDKHLHVGCVNCIVALIK